MGKTKTIIKLSKWLEIISLIKFIMLYFGLKKTTLKINGIPDMQPIAIRSSEKYTFIEIFANQCYNQFPIKDGYTILDLGASIGLFTIYCKLMAKNLNIIAVEPVPTNARVYYINTHTYPITKAVSNTTQDKIMIYNEDHPQGSGYYAVSGLPILRGNITLADLLAKVKKVDLMKMDIQGEEYNAIYACPTRLLTKIKRMIIECHFDKEDNKKLIKHLRNAGYRCTLHNGMLAARLK